MSLYNGLSAGLLRQATYTTARLGIFQIINAEAIKMNEGNPLPLYQKALCGLAAGGLGALVGTPADLTLIRMQAGARNSPAHALHSPPHKLRLHVHSNAMRPQWPALSQV
jgi:hypothetical protein